MRHLNESESIKTLKNLYLEKCSWSSDSARSELAKLLSLAPRLEICSIRFQQDELLDRIKVERTAAKYCPISQKAEKEAPSEADAEGEEEEAEEVKEIPAGDEDKVNPRGVNITPGQVIIKDMRGNPVAQIDNVRYKNVIRIYY